MQNEGRGSDDVLFEFASRVSSSIAWSQWRHLRGHHCGVSHTPRAPHSLHSSQRDESTLSDPEDPSFILSSQATWISEPDRQVFYYLHNHKLRFRVLLNELVQLGYHYQALDVFVENEGMPLTDTSQSDRSIYRRALAAGISGKSCI